MLVVVGLFVKGALVGKPGNVVIGRPTGLEIGIVLKPPTTFPVTVAGYPGLIGIYWLTLLTPGIELVRPFTLLVKPPIVLLTVPDNVPIEPPGF